MVVESGVMVGVGWSMVVVQLDGRPVWVGVGTAGAGKQPEPSLCLGGSVGETVVVNELVEKLVCTVVVVIVSPGKPIVCSPKLHVENISVIAN